MLYESANPAFFFGQAQWSVITSLTRDQAYLSHHYIINQETGAGEPSRAIQMISVRAYQARPSRERESFYRQSIYRV
jgi:hypothetical protein